MTSFHWFSRLTRLTLGAVDYSDCYRVVVTGRNLERIDLNGIPHGTEWRRGPGPRFQRQVDHHKDRGAEDRGEAGVVRSRERCLRR